MTPMTGYNAVIHLDTTKIAGYYDSISFESCKAPAPTSQFKNDQSPKDQAFFKQARIDVVGAYKSLLEKTFGHLAMFFVDVYGGDKIALVWKQGVLKPVPFKMNMLYNGIMMENETVNFIIWKMINSLNEIGWS
jgi:Nrap protein domain 6